MLIDPRQSDLGSRRKLLDALRVKGRMARVELAASTGLSPATVTALTADLLRDGYIETCEAAADAGGEGAAKRGRPRVELRLRAEATQVAGVKLSMHRIAVSITDFAGRMLGAADIEARLDRAAPAEIADMAAAALGQAAAPLGLQLSDMHGVGFGVPGYVDGDAGLCHWSPIFGEETIDAAALFSDRLGVPCFIDNDANLAALAEQWFGRGRGVANMVVVAIEQGVGMGAVIEGRLYRGARGLGAEFGHMKIQPNGALCRCGQRGCIEAYLADYAILREVGTFSALGAVGDPVAARSALAELQRAARAGDQRVQAVYARAGALLGVGLANLINLLAPELVVITGEGAEAWDLLAPSLRDALADNASSAAIRQARLEVTPNSDTLWARGAAAIVLDREDFAAGPSAAPDQAEQRVS